jgi:hypothetical protein
MFVPADLNLSNDELTTVALVLFICCAVIWLFYRFR